MIISHSPNFAPANVTADERPAPPRDARPAMAAPAIAPAPAAEPAVLAQQAVQMINKAFQTFSRSLHFSVDDTTGKTVVKVVDMETGDLIRQMPSQEALDIARTLDRLQGLLLNQQA